MKRIIILFLAGIFSNIGTNTFAQDCSSGFLGTKTLYSKPAQNNTANPPGYTSVFINYIGRHGARHLTKAVNTYLAYHLLFQADSSQVLTAKGKELWQQVLNLEKVEKGNTKSISAEGRAELQGIGQRLVQQNPDLFKQPANIKVSVTKEIRTAQSADAFFTGINSSVPKKPIVSKTINDISLRFYDFAPAYDAFKEGDFIGEKLKTLHQKEQISLINKAFTERIFKPDFAGKLSPKQTEKFTADIFGFATIVYSLKNEIAAAGLNPEKLNFKTFFTCAELAHLGLFDAAEDYLKKGPGMDLNGIQVKIAVPLLLNFIKTTDEFIATRRFDAQLRFGHAETILPFAALSNISSADKMATDLSLLNQVWQPENIAQLSSNVQWILYQQKGKKDLVKILLNENGAHITGLCTKTFPYYNWNDLKRFYLKKLASWNIKPDADMNLYLKELKAD